MHLTEYSLNDCVAAFNRHSPKPRDRRTVQRWLVAKQIAGYGSSRHNWFYPAAKVEGELRADFAAPSPSPKRARQARKTLPVRPAHKTDRRAA